MIPSTPHASRCCAPPGLPCWCPPPSSSRSATSQERVGPRAEAAFLRSITAGRIQLIHPEHSDIERAADLVERYADFPLGTVDACVMAIAERLNITKIATVDHRHFHAVKLRHCDGLELLPA